MSRGVSSRILEPAPQEISELMSLLERKDGMDLGDDDEFGIQLDDEPEEKSRGGASSSRGGRDGKEKARVSFESSEFSLR